MFFGLHEYVRVTNRNSPYYNRVGNIRDIDREKSVYLVEFIGENGLHAMRQSQVDLAYRLPI